MWIWSAWKPIASKVFELDAGPVRLIRRWNEMGGRAAVAGCTGGAK